MSYHQDYTNDYYSHYQQQYGYSWQQPASYPPATALPAPITLPTPPSSAGLPIQSLVTPPSAAPTLPAVAYTSVAIAAKAEPTRTEQEGSSRASSWPLSLRAYVERAFASVQPGPERSLLQQYLKGSIAVAQNSGELWTKDWDSEPLPQLSQSTATSRPQETAKEQLQYIASIPTEAPLKKGAKLRKRVRSPSPVAKVKMPRKATKRELKGLPSDDFGNLSLEDQQRLRARAGRFGDGTAIGAVERRKGKAEPMSNGSSAWIRPGSNVEAESLQDDDVVRGSCQNVEKSYFRLTSKPDPSTVRPEPVLWTALNRLVMLLREGKVTYFYAVDQFKGMRQDCTVQHLKNELSVSIYEAHARSALEYGDIGEYNQCQGQLAQHYAAGVSGCREEFLAYRILYQAVHAGKDNRVALLTCLQSVSSEDATHPSVRHALQVRQSLAFGDSTLACRLYISAPNMGRALLDILLPKIRFAALRVFAKAYSPAIPTSFIARHFGFVAVDQASQPQQSAQESCAQAALPGCSKETFCGQAPPQRDVSKGERECEEWLLDHGAVLVSTPGAGGERALDCKASAGTLRMPVRSAVAHGDINLAIDDFLAHTLM